MARRRVLVVEDDPAIRRVIVDALSIDGFETLEAGTWAEGLRAATGAACDCLLLDLVLPGGDGLAILAEARVARPTLPILIMTARGDEDDRVEGLRLGADDYVVKPFGIKELLARGRAGGGEGGGGGGWGRPGGGGGGPARGRGAARAGLAAAGAPGPHPDRRH